MLPSCIDDVNLNIDNAESRISFYCEFEPGKVVSFKYATATGLSDLLEPIAPTTTSAFDITFKQNGTEIDPTFRYNPITGYFDAQIQTFPVEQGAFYDVSTELLELPEIGKAEGTTYVPMAKEFSSLDLLELNKTGEESGYNLQMKARFTIDATSPYYEVEIFTRSIINSRIVDVPLDFALVNKQAGVLQLEHRNSLLIDSKKNKGQYVTVLIDDSVSETALEFSDNVFFKLKTINEHHYYFHENLAKRIESVNAPISEPVIYYTNMDNGLGLFSGYSSVTDTISIK